MQRVRAFFSGWLGLARFWAGIVFFLAASALALQGMEPGGHRAPPPAPAVAVVTPDAAPAPVAEPAPLPQAIAKPIQPMAEHPARDTPGPVADPDPALQEPYGSADAEYLPRIAPDGRKPMNLYAGGSDPSSVRPRIGLIIAGFGQIPADTKVAINDLPAGVSFAVSPYTRNLEPLLASARLLGHEYWLSLPMEPEGFPTNDPGPRALMTNLSPEQNLPRLNWFLSRLNGYVGVTPIMGALRGSRFIEQPAQLQSVLRETNQRGLIYLDPRNAVPDPRIGWARGIDIIIDEPATAAEIDAKLTAIEKRAREQGSAVGLVTAPRPVMVERLTAWTAAMTRNGVAFAPLSALMLPATAAQ